MIHILLPLFIFTKTECLQELGQIRNVVKTNYDDTGQWLPVSENLNLRLLEGPKSIKINNSTNNVLFSRRRSQVHSSRKTFLLDKEEKISVTKNAIVQKIKDSVARFIDNLAFKFVGWSERLFGSRADVQYNQELKTLSAFGLDFDLLFALDQFILILTEFVAYITTDVIFRTFWPV